MKKLMPSLIFLCLFFLILPKPDFAAQVNSAPNVGINIPKMEIEGVVKKAKEYARSQGQEIDDYFIGSVKYQIREDNWLVFFEGNLPAPGNHFLISINDSSGEIKLFRGE